jgi:hypothetical protein
MVKIEVRTECAATIECPKGNEKAVAAVWTVGGDTVVLNQALGGKITMSRAQLFALAELAPRMGAQP